MAFASGADNIDIVIRVDAEGAVRILNQVGEEIGKVAEKSEDAGGGFSRFEAKLVTLQAGLSLAASAIKAVGGAFDLAIGAISEGSRIADIEEAFNDLSVAAGTSAEVLEGRLSQAVGGTIASVDLLAKANQQLRAGLKPDEIVAVAEASRFLAEQTGGNAAQEIDALTQALLTGRDTALKVRGVIVDTDAAYAAYAATVGKTVQQLNEEEKVQIRREAILQKVSEVAEKGRQVQLDAGDAVERFSTLIKNGLGEVQKAIGGNQELADGLNDVVSALSKIDFKPFIAGLSSIISVIGKAISLLASFAEKVVSVANTAISAAKALTDFVGITEKAKKPVSDLTQAAENFANSNLNVALDMMSGAMGDVADTSLDAEARLVDLGRSVDDLTSEADDLQNAIRDVQTNIRDVGTTSTQTAQEIKQVGDAVAQVQVIAARRMGGGAEGGGASGGSFWTGLFGTEGDRERLQTDLGDTLGGILAGGLANGLNAALSGDKGALKNAARDLGSQSLGAIGEAYGGPIGQAIGSVLGDKLGKGVFDAIDHIFGGRDAQGKIRDSMDRFFADLLKDNPALVIIEGQLKEIADLEFLKDTDAFETGVFDDLLQSLPQSAQAAFEGMGIAFSSFVEGAGAQSSQLAAILANNLGGSLNNLQLLVQATGISFDQLAGQVEQAFLRGEISAAQAFSALGQIQQISQKGIPDGIGLVEKAFENLKAAGTKGGAALVDALQDIGSEAKELGITTLAGVQQKLAETGQFSAQEIQQVFSALEAAGITSIDQLENATVQQLLPALAQLENQQFPFEKAVQDVEQLIDTVNELPNNITKKVRVEVEYVATGDEQAQRDAQSGNTEGP